MKTDTINRILIIEVNWVGDILFTTPAIRAIRENYPGAFIACLSLPRCVEMLEGNPHIDEIIVFDERGRHRGLLGRLSLIKALKNKRFDTVISFHRSMSRVLMAYLAGIKKRIGYATKKRSWLLTDAVALPEKLPHRVEYFLDIVRYIGIDTKNRDYEFFIPKEALKKTEYILQDIGISPNEGFFVVNPGANWLPKRWPATLYAELCKRLKERYNKKIIITGSQKDADLTKEIMDGSNNSTLSLCGKTNLKELGAVMRRASLVIANDSGPMHIAVSQKAPTVAIFGPTSPKITGPYGNAPYISLHKWVDCDIPCYNICDKYRCMETVSIEDVMQAAGELLSDKNR